MADDKMRAEFEAHHKVPDKAFYKKSVDAYKYEQYPTVDHPVNELWESFCDGWTAARAQSAEPVAEVIPNVVGVEIAWLHPRKAQPEGTKLYTHPPARAQNGDYWEGYEEGVKAARAGFFDAQSEEPVAVAEYEHYPDDGTKELYPLDGFDQLPDGSGFLYAHPPARAQGWTPCSERLPTEADSDCEFHVWVFMPIGFMGEVRNSVFLVPWDTVVNRTDHLTHWKPTGLERPEPPE